MRLVLLGPPGAGKGTQAKFLAQRYNIAHVSTGNILRQEVQEGTDLGRQAETFMTAGNLVPDHLIIRMVEKRIAEPDCRSGFLLDGFPRTVAQADALGGMFDRLGLQLDAVLLITVEDESLVRRLSGRRWCSRCGAVYHLEFSAPKQDGRCDQCAGDLVQREDDREETVRNRLLVYHKQTGPLIEYYRSRNLLRAIDGTGSIEAVTQRMEEILQESTTEGRSLKGQ